MVDLHICISVPLMQEKLLHTVHTQDYWFLILIWFTYHSDSLQYQTKKYFQKYSQIWNIPEEWSFSGLFFVRNCTQKEDNRGIFRNQPNI